MKRLACAGAPGRAAIPPRPLPSAVKTAMPAAMDDTLHPALLPAGLGDLLPPEAQVEADVVNALMATLQAHGYERVKPPLVVTLNRTPT